MFKAQRAAVTILSALMATGSVLGPIVTIGLSRHPATDCGAVREQEILADAEHVGWRGLDDAGDAPSYMLVRNPTPTIDVSALSEPGALDGVRLMSAWSYAAETTPVSLHRVTASASLFVLMSASPSSPTPSGSGSAPSPLGAPTSPVNVPVPASPSTPAAPGTQPSRVPVSPTSPTPGCSLVHEPRREEEQENDVCPTGITRGEALLKEAQRAFAMGETWRMEVISELAIRWLQVDDEQARGWDQLINHQGTISMAIRHRHYDLLRREQAQQKYTRRYAEARPSRTDERDRLEARDTLNDLAALDESTRTIVHLSAVGYSAEEIADQLEPGDGPITSTAVRKRISRVRRALKRAA